IMLPILKQPGTNVVAVVDAVKALLPTLREQLPASVSLDTRFDRSVSIRDSVHDVKFTLILTVCLVVLVIFIFLRNISATIIPSLALPASIVGTFAVMYLLDYSLDSLSPMLASRFLRPPHAQKHGFIYNTIEKMFDTWLRLYDWTLRGSLRFHAVPMAISIALLIGTWYLFQVVPKGFLPSEDQGRFSISTAAVQGISLDEMTRHQPEVADVVGKDPNVAQIQIQVGGGGFGSGGLNTGRVMVELKPRADRALSVDQLIANLRP